VIVCLITICTSTCASSRVNHQLPQSQIRVTIDPSKLDYDKQGARCSVLIPRRLIGRFEHPRNIHGHLHVKKGIFWPSTQEVLQVTYWPFCHVSQKLVQILTPRLSRKYVPISSSGMIGQIITRDSDRIGGSQLYRRIGAYLNHGRKLILLDYYSVSSQGLSVNEVKAIILSVRESKSYRRNGPNK
jgi:hypothetical protein